MRRLSVLVATLSCAPLTACDPPEPDGPPLVEIVRPGDGALIGATGCVEAQFDCQPTSVEWLLDDELLAEVDPDAARADLAAQICIDTSTIGAGQHEVEVRVNCGDAHSSDTLEFQTDSPQFQLLSVEANSGVELVRGDTVVLEVFADR